MSSPDATPAAANSDAVVPIVVAAKLQTAAPAAVEGAASAYTTSICRALGLPASACVVTVIVKDDLPPGSIECTVNGRACRHDRQTERLLKEYVGNDPDEAAAETEYIALLVRHAVSLQPAILLNDRVLDDWLRRVPAPPAREDGAMLLAGLLDARVRVDDHAAIAKLVTAEKPTGEVLEDCIAALSATQVTVRIAQAYYGAICAGPAGDVTQAFDEMRRGLFDELGVLCPCISVQPDPELRDRGFAVVMNALTGTPRAGIAANRVHVNDTPERLKLLNVEALDWPGPNLRFPAAVVAPDKEEMLTAAGLSVLRPLPYLVAAVREELQRHAALLVHQEALAMSRTVMLKGFPALTEAALAAVPFWQLTAALRELARDGVPLRSLPVILERVVDLPFSAEAKNRYSIGDDRISSDESGGHAGHLASFLRAGLAREIAWTVSRQTATVVVYLSDERKLAPLHEGRGTQFEETMDQFVRALEAEMAFLPPTAQVPALLTLPETAKLIRPSLRVRFPKLAVLSHSDLPADVNVQPVARIGL